MITEDYVSFETAKLLKEKGFGSECLRFYIPNGHGKWKYEHYHDFDISDRIECPTIQMAMKWLREVHGLYITITHRFLHNADNDVCFGYYVNIDTAQDGEWLTYEEACEAAIKYCLENLI